MCELVKVVGVGDVVRGLFARALVRGDVDPHCGGLGAREADGGAIVIEVRDSALFECLWGWIDAHVCEVVCCLAVRQYVKQTEKVSADSPGGVCVYYCSTYCKAVRVGGGG
jgi:hypothetical protein